MKIKSNQFSPFCLLPNFDSLRTLIRVFPLKGESLHSNIGANIRNGSKDTCQVTLKGRCFINSGTQVEEFTG